MRATVRFDPAAFVEWLGREGIRYLLIGGQAVRMYGSPRVTYDFDFWVESTQRRKVLEYLEATWDLELTHSPDSTNRPIVSAIGDRDKIDLFFVRALVSPTGESLTFEDAYVRASLRGEEESTAVRLPSIDDLIFLKQLAPTPRPNDVTDIRFLEVCRALASSEGPD